MPTNIIPAQPTVLQMLDGNTLHGQMAGGDPYIKELFETIINAINAYNSEVPTSSGASFVGVKNSGFVNFSPLTNDVAAALDAIDSSLSSAGTGNVIANGQFEVNANGWVTYNNGPVAVPVDGISGLANITFARTIINPLFGVGSGLLTKDAVNRQGQGFSRTFALPLGLQNQPLQITFTANTGGGYVAGDVQAFVFDIDTATLITPTPNEINSGLGRQSFIFNSTSSVNYRLIFHIATVNAAAYTLEIDNIVVGGILSQVDQIGTVFVASTTVSAVIPYTKVSTDTFLRFTYSGAAIGNVTGSALISIPDIPYSITYTTQGPPASIGQVTTTYNAGIGTPLTGSNGPFNLTTASVTGNTGASPINGQDWIDVTGLSNGLHNITITFTNLTQPTLAIYKNRG